jgi:D-alanine-D-alanine ligase
VRIIRENENYRILAEDSWVYGEEVLVEEYIPGHELTVAVMGDKALNVTELRPKAGFYDYTAKYTDGMTDHLIPAPVPPEVAAAAKAHAETMHKALGCCGISRSDFRWDAGRGLAGLIFLEINTQPGFTPLSLVPEQAKAAGISYADLCVWLVENAKCHV